MLAPGSARPLSQSDVPPGSLWRLSGDQLPHAEFMAKQMGSAATAVYDGTFRREVAQQHPSNSFFTVGHPLFESLVASLESQGQGRTYAVECEIPGQAPWMGIEFVFRALPNLEGLEHDPALSGQARALFSQRPVHVFIHESGHVEREPDRFLQLRTSCNIQTKERMWWNLTKEKAGVLKEVFPRGWTVVLPELNTRAEAHAREALARRLDPLVEEESVRLEELARRMRNDPDAEPGQEEAVHRLVKAVRGWKVVLDAAGFLAINSSVLRNR